MQGLRGGKGNSYTEVTYRMYAITSIHRKIYGGRDMLAIENMLVEC